jgi:hypothetical protein
LSYNLCQEKMEAAADLAIKGCSIRQIAKGAGIGKQTAMRIQQAYRRAFAKEGLPVKTCGCGQKQGHRGWCRYLYIRSTKRQAFMQRWRNKTFAALAQL